MPANERTGESSPPARTKAPGPATASRAKGPATGSLPQGLAAPETPRGQHLEEVKQGQGEEAEHEQLPQHGPQPSRTASSKQEQDGAPFGPHRLEFHRTEREIGPHDGLPEHRDPVPGMPTEAVHRVADYEEPSRLPRPHDHVQLSPVELEGYARSSGLLKALEKTFAPKTRQRASEGCEAHRPVAPFVGNPFSGEDLSLRGDILMEAQSAGFLPQVTKGLTETLDFAQTLQQDSYLDTSLNGLGSLASAASYGAADVKRNIKEAVSAMGESQTLAGRAHGPGRIPTRLAEQVEERALQARVKAAEAIDQASCLGHVMQFLCSSLDEVQQDQRTSLWRISRLGGAHRLGELSRRIPGEAVDLLSQITRSLTGQTGPTRMFFCR